MKKYFDYDGGAIDMYLSNGAAFSGNSFTSIHTSTGKCTACEKYFDYEMYLDLVLKSIWTQISQKSINSPRIL